MAIFQKKLPLWKIFTKLCLVGKFPQQQALLENFRKKLLCQNISTNPCLVGKFPVKTLVGKVSSIVFLLENFHKKLLHCKFPQKFAFWGNLHNNLLCLKISITKFHLLTISTKNQFVEKLPQKIPLFENFQTKSIFRKISKKNQLVK